MVGHCRVQIMICRRLVISLRFSPLSHLVVHSPALGPLLTPVIPPLNAVRDALKVIEVHAIGNEPGSPVINRALYLFVSRHVVILSRLWFYALESVPPRSRWPISGLLTLSVFHPS